MIESTSLLYKFIQNRIISIDCLELADNIINSIPLNSELIIIPDVRIVSDCVIIEYDTDCGEFSLWVIDRSEFYVEWGFSAKNSDTFIDGFYISLEQIIYMVQNSSFGGHK